jgi:hypothetical protein
MTRFAYGFIGGLAFALLVSTDGAAQTVNVAQPAQPGPVDGTSENSDAFIWRLFTEFVAPASLSQPTPVFFETWASDDDTFSTTPHWPEPGTPMKLHASLLATLKTQPTVEPDAMARLLASIDVPCKAPGNAAVGAFPTKGNPTPCIGEQTKRNRAQFDYIVKNNLNTKAGLAAAFAKGLKVEMPPESIAIKGDWVPLTDLLQWVPELRDITNIKKLYYTTVSSSVEYALVAMHVSSRQNPNWVWGTFEHQMNPGRCDFIGCFDSFGSTIPSVPPNHAAINTQYGACPKTPALKALMSKAGVSPVWENYCLKSTEVDYTAADGTPYVLGNSVIEGIVGNGTIAASSCIACHVYASFNKDGKVSDAARAMLPFNPTGRPIPSVLADSAQFAFMWGVILAPPR